MFAISGLDGRLWWKEEMHYVLSTVDKDIEMLVQDNSANYADTNLNYRPYLVLPLITLQLLL